MNKPLRRVAISAMLLIVVLMINVNYIQGSQADKLKTDPLNARQFADAVPARPRRDHGGRRHAGPSQKIKGDKKNYQRVYNQGELTPRSPASSACHSRTGMEGAENALLDGTDKRLSVTQLVRHRSSARSRRARPCRPRSSRRRSRPPTTASRQHDAQRGAAVAIDVKTGAILAMASYPSYDTNQVATHDGDKAYKALAAARQARPASRLLNKAMNETFAPGSSFKIIDSAAAHRARRAHQGHARRRRASSMLPSRASTLPNSDGDEAKCSGTPPLINSFAASCNSTFGRLAGTSRPDQRSAPRPTSSASTSRSRSSRACDSATTPTTRAKASWAATTSARSGIGQGDVTATPLQMAMVAQRWPTTAPR